MNTQSSHQIKLSNLLNNGSLVTQQSLSVLLNCGNMNNANENAKQNNNRGILNGLSLNTLNTTQKPQVKNNFAQKQQQQQTENLNAAAVLQLIYQQQLVNEAAVAAAAAALTMTDANQTAVAAAAAATRYKTELCRSYQESGQCKYGDKCQFAHGQHELRNMMRHPRYKTELCRTFHAQGYCPYGPRCHFVHDTTIDRKNNISKNVSKSTSPIIFEAVANLTNDNNTNTQSLLMCANTNTHRKDSTSSVSSLSNQDSISSSNHSSGASSANISPPSSRSLSPESFLLNQHKNSSQFCFQPSFTQTTNDLFYSLLNSNNNDLIINSSHPSSSASSCSSSSSSCSSNPNNNNHESSFNLNDDSTSMIVNQILNNLYLNNSLNQANTSGDDLDEANVSERSNSFGNHNAKNIDELNSYLTSNLLI